MYQKSILDNGIRVVSEAIPHVKSVSIGVWVNTGSRNEREDEHGVSHFLEHMVFKGTQHRTAFQISEEIDALGGGLGHRGSQRGLGGPVTGRGRRCRARGRSSGSRPSRRAAPVS